MSAVKTSAYQVELTLEIEAPDAETALAVARCVAHNGRGDWSGFKVARLAHAWIGQGAQQVES